MTWAFSQEFAQKWLQQLVVHHEDLALLALRLNERNRLEDEAARGGGKGGLQYLDDDDDEDEESDLF